MDTEVISWIVTIVLGLAAAIFGVKFYNIRTAVFAVVDEVKLALEDNKVTKEELLKIMEKVKAVLAAWKT